MDDAATLALLHRHVAWGVRPGARVVMHADIKAVGADFERVDRFVLGNGGRSVTARGATETGLADHWLLPGEAFFR